MRKTGCGSEDKDGIGPTNIYSEHISRLFRWTGSEPLVPPRRIFYG
jgi:hypothetical protein